MAQLNITYREPNDPISILRWTICAGTLISDRHILAPIHCMYRNTSRYYVDLKIKLGSPDPQNGQQVQWVAFVGITNFVWIDDITDSDERDLTVITLQSPVTISGPFYTTFHRQMNVSYLLHVPITKKKGCGDIVSDDLFTLTKI